jgi:hypothetical protein
MHGVYSVRCCSLSEGELTMADEKNAGTVQRHPIHAGPTRVIWIKVIKDGTEPPRVFYQGQLGQTTVYHYFDLKAANSGQLAILGESMAAARDIYWDGVNGNSLFFIVAAKSAPTTGAQPRLPAGTVHTHDPVENIRF